LRPSSIAWDHHYGIMLPLYVVTLYALLTGAPLRLQGSGLLLLALSWCLSASLLPQLRAIDLPPWNIVQAYVFFGATMLLGLMLVLARPSARHGRVKSPQPHHARP
jgi:hypothetical protein